MTAPSPEPSSPGPGCSPHTRLDRGFIPPIPGEVKAELGPAGMVKVPQQVVASRGAALRRTQSTGVSVEGR